MKIIKKITITLLILLTTKISFAVDWWFLWDWTTWKKLRDGSISVSDIPNMITYAINFFMWIAATISVIFIIIWAYKILFGSISQDKTKWRDTILMAIWGFIIASLAWFIIKLVLDNFS